jgi:hypothetical protein
MATEIKIQIENKNEDEIAQIVEIFTALLQCGGLNGVKAGSTNIHYDEQGTFQGIKFEYWPWKKRRKPVDNSRP